MASSLLDEVASIEVADSSLNFDPTTKQRSYAAANVPVFWIMNIPEKRIEVYETPNSSTGHYVRVTEFTAGQTIRLQFDDDVFVEFDVAQRLT